MCEPLNTAYSELSPVKLASKVSRGSTGLQPLPPPQVHNLIVLDGIGPAVPLALVESLRAAAGEAAVRGCAVLRQGRRKSPEEYHH